MGSEHQMNRRRHSRVSVPVSCVSPNLFQGRRRVVNVSVGGIRIYTDKHVGIGETVEIELHLPTRKPILGRGRVAWERTLPELAPYRYDLGLEFIGMETADAEDLARFIAQCQPLDSVPGSHASDQSPIKPRSVSSRVQ